MNATQLPTMFAPAERSSADVVQRQSKYFVKDWMLNFFFASVFDILVVLNKERQIVMANHHLAALVGLENVESLMGLRFGEAVGCEHALDMEGGCGTTEFCRECGAIRATLQSQKGIISVDECRIARNPNLEPLELRVWASPFSVEGERFSLVAMLNVADEKRRRILERIFFHDVLNTAGGLMGFAEMLEESEPDQINEIRTPLVRLTKQLVDEIAGQRDLAVAESGDFQLQPAPLSSLSLVKQVVELYKKHQVADNREIAIDPSTREVQFESDARLLRRILGNMVKNALEASEENTKVTVGCRAPAGSVEFWVHNEQMMPRSVQLQVFQRSFSTKGSDRGLGTYSMKLLGERWLGGKVTFSSSPGEGTLFKFSLPLPNK